jgi:hypothetical protein
LARQGVSSGGLNHEIDGCGLARLWKRRRWVRRGDQRAVLLQTTFEAPGMPLKRMLEEARTFDPKAVALLLEASDGTVAELDLRALADRDKAAKIIMRLARGQATLDASKLQDEAVRLMRKRGTTGRRRAF